MDIRDNEGWTALHAAASCGSVEIAQWVCVCFIHFIVISSWTGLAFGLNCDGWKSTTAGGISWTFNTINLMLSMVVVNLYRVSKHARNSVQILKGFFFDVWILRSEASFALWNFSWRNFLVIKSFCEERIEVTIKLLFSRTQSLVSRKFYIKWPKLYEIPLKCCISGLRLMNQSCRFHNMFCNVLLCLARKSIG